MRGIALSQLTGETKMNHSSWAGKLIRFTFMVTERLALITAVSAIFVLGAGLFLVTTQLRRFTGADIPFIISVIAVLILSVTWLLVTRKAREG